jgi:thiosulfate/3-mercaptopyruvate sulfurtransferase
MAVETSPLVSAEVVARWRREPVPLVLVDCRWYLAKPGGGREAYGEGHLPGAIFLDLDHDLADPAGFGAPGRHPLPDPDVFTARMAAAGIGDGARVVGYDDVGGWVAARLWWMLDNLGFGRRGIEGEWVGVLDGGINAWTEAGEELSVEVRPQEPAPQGLHLADAWHGVIARDELRSRLGSVTLLDARAGPRYRGEIEPVDPVAGHIPTAINAPFDSNLTPAGRFKSVDELREQYAALGIGAAGSGPEAVTSCGSGTSAAHHSLAMRYAGLPDPVLYVGSYSDWSRSGEQIATGEEPGSPPFLRPHRSGRA